jgi:hypothetical protein
MEGVYMSKQKPESYEEGEEENEYGDSEYAHEAHEQISRQLNLIIHNAKNLLHACKCKAEGLLDPEAQESITLANDYIDNVHDYVMSGDSYEESGQEEEEPLGFVVAVEKAMQSNGRR